MFENIQRIPDVVMVEEKQALPAEGGNAFELDGVRVETVPEGEALALCRRLSPGALRAFPGRIEYAGRAGAPGAKAAPEDPPEPAAPEPPPEPACEEEAPQAEPAEEPQAETEEPQPEAQTEAPPGIEDLYWYASPDGALVCFDGTENLIALPLGDARIPGGGGGWRKRIEGRDYIVYRTKDGRLLR